MIFAISQHLCVWGDFCQSQHNTNIQLATISKLSLCNSYFLLRNSTQLSYDYLLLYNRNHRFQSTTKKKIGGSINRFINPSSIPPNFHHFFSFSLLSSFLFLLLLAKTLYQINRFRLFLGKYYHSRFEQFQQHTIQPPVHPPLIIELFFAQDEPQQQR